MVKETIELQDMFNSIVDPEWKNKQYKWSRYIWVEAAELMESLNFKHWKNQEVDWDNVVVELIDIFHFALSYTIAFYGKDRAIDIVEKAKEQVYIRYENIEAFRVGVDNIAYIASKMAINKGVTYTDFNSLFVYIFILWDSVFSLSGKEYVSIFKQYIVKNALNKFRQDNGYKDGGYVKVWNGVEDNVYAYTFAEMYKGEDGLFDFIYAQLTKEYRYVV